MVNVSTRNTKFSFDWVTVSQEDVYHEAGWSLTGRGAASKYLPWCQPYTNHNYSNYQTFHNLGVLTVNVTLLLTIALSLKNPRTSQKAFIETESKSSSCSSSVLCFCWNDAVCWQNDCFSWYFLRANYVSDYLGRYLGDWDEIFPAKSARSCPETVGQRRVYTGRYSEADKERYLAQNKQNKILPLTVNDIYINQVLLTTFQQVETSTLSSLRSSNFNCFDKIFVFES